MKQEVLKIKGWIFTVEYFDDIVKYCIRRKEDEIPIFSTVSKEDISKFIYDVGEDIMNIVKAKLYHTNNILNFGDRRLVIGYNSYKKSVVLRIDLMKGDPNYGKYYFDEIKLDKHKFGCLFVFFQRMYCEIGYNVRWSVL